MPRDLILAVARITRLRIQVAHETITNADLEDRTRDIWTLVDRFSAEKWARDTGFHRGDATVGLGKIAQLAAQIYLLLSLPRLAVAAALAEQQQPGSPATPGRPSSESLRAYHSVRVSKREKMVQLLRETWPMVKGGEEYRWNFMVAGVVVADGLKPDQDFIAQELYEIWEKPFTDAASFMLLEKLRGFWRSGKTGWEDCFYEPFPG